MFLKSIKLKCCFWQHRIVEIAKTSGQMTESGESASTLLNAQLTCISDYDSNCLNTTGNESRTALGINQRLILAKRDDQAGNKLFPWRFLTLEAVRDDRPYLFYCCSSIRGVPSATSQSHGPLSH